MPKPVTVTMFWTLQFWQHPYLGHGQLQKVGTIFTRWIIGVLAKSATSLLWISRGQAPWPAFCSYFRLLAELYLRFKASIWDWGKADLGITANEQGLTRLAWMVPKIGLKGGQRLGLDLWKDSMKFERSVFGNSNKSLDFTLCSETALTDFSPAWSLVF